MTPRLKFFFRFSRQSLRIAQSDIHKHGQSQKSYRYHDDDTFEIIEKEEEEEEGRRQQQQQQLLLLLLLLLLLGPYYYYSNNDHSMYTISAYTYLEGHTPLHISVPRRTNRHICLSPE